MSNNLQPFVTLVRQHIKQPLVLGFGISTTSQAQEAGNLVDGVIVGSKLINIAEESDNPPQACGKFVNKMVEALQQNN